MISADARPIAAVERSLRQRVYEQLEPTARQQGLSPVNRLVVVAILAITLIAIVDTEPLVRARYGHLINIAEISFGCLFLVEYLARCWASVENPRFGPSWRGRLRFALSPGGLIDLVAVAVTLAPVIAGNALALRVFRLLRILALARLGRLSSAMRHLSDAVASRRHELMLTVILALGIMVAGASALWLAEGAIQPTSSDRSQGHSGGRS